MHSRSPDKVIGTAALYGGLFAAAFVAATILPAQSEAAVSAMLLAGHGMLPVVAVASLGNTLGAVVNWWLGREAGRFAGRRWFPLNVAQLDRAAGWYGRWGRWSLLLSWLPVGGDALTVAAGLLREPLPSFAVLVAAAKTARYVAVAWAVQPFLA